MAFYLFLFFLLHSQFLSSNAHCMLKRVGPDVFNIVFYVHGIRVAFENRQVSVVPFTGVTPQFTGFTIGYPAVVDNKLTTRSIYNSTECGRSQGTEVFTSLDGTTATLTTNVAFHGHDGYIHAYGKYNSSKVVNTLVVSGGTEDFLGAQGIYKFTLIKKYGPYNANLLFLGNITFHRFSFGNLPRV